MNYTEKILCDNIIFLFKLKNLNIESMAKIMGISEKDMKDLLNGKVSSHIPIAVLFNIHEYFGVPPYSLLGDNTDIIEKYCDIHDKKADAGPQRIPPVSQKQIFS